MTAPRLNGCHNRAPLVRTLRMQDGWVEMATSRRPVIVDQPAMKSRDCEYSKSDLGQKDAKCQGCRWRQKVANG